jgi:hypothetical protein
MPFGRVSDVYLLCEAHSNQNCNGTSHEGPTSAPRRSHNVQSMRGWRSLKVTKTADVQFDVVMTTDEHSVSTLASHAGQRHRLIGIVQGIAYHSASGGIGKSSNGMGREQGSAAADRGC